MVVWFRYGDLRVHDNPVLTAASAAPGSKEVLPVFCFDPRHFGRASFGCEKSSARRTSFLLESVADLRKSLRSLGSDLLVGVGKPEDLLSKLCGPDDSVFCAEQVASEELRVDAAVRRSLPTGARLKPVWSGTLYDAADIKLQFGGDYSSMPDVFTPFRNKVESRLDVPAPRPAPKQGSLPLAPTGAEAGPCGFDALPTLTELGYSEEAAKAAAFSDPRGVLPFAGGETAARARLQHYLWDSDSLGAYFETRNGMLGADYSSKFAPWLALGCLSAREVKAQCEAYERARVKNKSTYWLVFELIWRDFFRFYTAKHGDKIFHLEGPARVSQSWVRNPEMLQRWREGRTGVPLVDANMRELAATGFMSNRGRQNVASYLALDLKLDWRAGAAFFEELLLDYDVCSNWGNWAAAAGVTGGRINRFNIVKQSKDYDADGEYVRHWLPELAEVPAPKCHEPWQLSKEEQQRYGLTLGVHYPLPPKSNWAGFDDRRSNSGGRGGYSGRGGGVPSTPSQAAAMAGRGGGKARGRGGGRQGRKRVQHDHY